MHFTIYDLVFFKSNSESFFFNLQESMLIIDVIIWYVLESMYTNWHSRWPIYLLLKENKYY